MPKFPPPPRSPQKSSAFSALRLAVELAPGDTRLDASRSSGGIDMDTFEPREFDDDAVVADRVPSDVVAPPRTATSRPVSRAKSTAVTTSATPVQRAISAGHFPIIPFQIRRADS
jgi:hypothetical protein